MNHPRQVLTRATIFDRVWGYDFGPSSNSLEVYIGYLRRKTEAAGEPRLVHTVRGVGYVLRSPGMSFRRRIVLLSAAAVAAAIVIASIVVYVVTRDELRGQVDASLRRRLVPGPESIQVTRRVDAPGAARPARTRREASAEAEWRRGRERRRCDGAPPIAAFGLPRSGSQRGRAEPDTAPTKSKRLTDSQLRVLEQAIVHAARCPRPASFTPSRQAHSSCS